jgi:DNA-binding MarR family transcriptional regulator
MQGSEDEAGVREVVLSGTRALVGVAARSLAAASDEVTLAQFRVLVLLDGAGRLTMGELAASLDVNPSTVTRLCDALVDKRLVRRVPDRDNRRLVCAELAPAGRRLVDHVMDRRRALIDDALGRMTPAAQRRLARSLTEFAAAAGQLSRDAWILGWPVDENDTVA